MGGAVPDGFLTVIPDLAVEIRSPTDRAIALVGEHDAIDGGAVLPGLRIPLASLWSDALG